MKELKNTTKAAQAIINEFNRANRQRKTIYQAYSKPSYRKVSAYNEIAHRASNTPGYNNDLTVSGTSSNFFSTLYSYTEAGKTYLIKDTASNIYKVALA